MVLSNKYVRRTLIATTTLIVLGTIVGNAFVVWKTATMSWLSAVALACAVAMLIGTIYAIRKEARQRPDE